MAEPLIGVNINDPVLRRKEKQEPRAASEKNVKDMLDFCALNHWRLIRIPYYWEASIGNEDNFFMELAYLLEGCKSRGMYAIPDFHHFYGSSAWGKDGAGFPSHIVAKYPAKPGVAYDEDPAIKAFWGDLYSDAVVGVDSVWQEIAKFQAQVAEVERTYASNVYGHEILNEPHIWNDGQYVKLGKMLTAIGKWVRNVCGEPMIFTRETGRGGYKRSPTLEPLIRPKLKRTIYSPHLYRADALGAQVKQWNGLIANWKAEDPAIKCFVGEFADQEAYDKWTPANVEAFVKTWHDQNYDSTFWAAFLNTPDSSNRLTDPGWSLTPLGKFYTDTIKKYYTA